MAGLTDDLPELPRDWGPLYEQPPAPRPTRSVQEVMAELGRPLTERERVNLLAEDDVIRAIAQGASINSICKELGLSWWALDEWLSESTQRRSRYERARKLAAVMFEERAEQVLLTAPPTIAELTRAKALSALLQRRAQTHDPALYGDRQQVTVTHDVIADLKARIHAAGQGLPMAPTPMVQRLSDRASD